MLDYQAIQQAVNNEKNAGGFAELMKEFVQLGIKKYDYLVAKGLYRYYDENSSIELKMNGVPKPVDELGETLKIRQAVTNAQVGAISFEQFCQLAGEAGVAYWVTDLTTKEVTYFDSEDFVLLIEPIPGL